MLLCHLYIKKSLTTEPTQDTMKLYYFDIYARAEPLRILLSHAKAEYENVYITKEDLAKLKEEGKLEFGQVPVLEHNGNFLA